MDYCDAKHYGISLLSMVIGDKTSPHIPEIMEFFSLFFQHLLTEYIVTQ
jgi:hypothetical protein